MGTTRAAPGPADRSSLIDLAGRYLAALAAHDPGSVPLAPDVRVVEDLRPIRPGEGLWASTTAGPTEFAVYVPDPQHQSIGYVGLLERDGEPALVALRLSLDGGHVTECEHLVATNVTDSLDNLRTPRPVLRAEIPEQHRLDGDELIAIGATYYDALADNDASRSPLATDCDRHENGRLTGGPSHSPRADSRFPPVATDCSAQIDSQVFTYIKGIDDRRVFAADRVTGLVMGFSLFRHPMDNVPYEVTLPDGSTSTFTPGFDPFDLPAAHIFKVGADGQIHGIEALGFVAPYGSLAS